MFNLLGNLLFGYGQEQTKNEEAPQLMQTEQSTTTTTTTQSTQTLDNNTEATNTAATASETTTKKPEDWVIVDKSEEGDKDLVMRNDAATNTSMTQSKLATATTEENEAKASSLAKLTESSNSTILGSFFEKNEAEDEEFNRRYKLNRVHGDDNKDWLITPLPCLTSIHASQRSIVDNDPLENLLIEHPSMSVFVAATSSSDASFQEEEENKMNVDENKKNVVLTKSVSEKRKTNASSNVSSNGDSPTTTLKRKSKKNKKSSSSSSPSGSTSNVPAGVTTRTNNKENLQVLLANDFKKHANTQARLESLLLNKNQIKRSNKNSVFAATKQCANKQRKYHQLYQPFCLANRVF